MITDYNKGITFREPVIEGMVSVVIPSHNREHTIRRAVESVLNQTYEKIEVIVVDDCSTDDTESVVKAIGDNRITFIKLTENVGACRARNIGAEVSHGQWIAFQDSDDEWLPEKTSKQLAFMTEGKYDFTFCQANLILQNGETVLSPKACYGNEKDRDWYHILMTDFPVSTQKFMFTRRVLEKFGFDENLAKSQDKDIALQVSHEFKTGYLAEPLVNIYATQDSITYSGNPKKKFDSIQRIYSKHKDEFTEYPKGNAFFLNLFADYAYANSRWDAVKYYYKSLCCNFNKRVLVKLIVSILGIRDKF